ncbi:MAG: hypothetical protein WHT84_07745 [Breznakiellaceae bacterium]
MVRLLELFVVLAYTIAGNPPRIPHLTFGLLASLGGEIQDTIPPAVRLLFCTFSLIYQFLTIY